MGCHWRATPEILKFASGNDWKYRWINGLTESISIDEAMRDENEKCAHLETKNIGIHKNQADA